MPSPSPFFYFLPIKFYALSFAFTSLIRVLFFPSTDAVFDSAFDLATLSFIALLLLLSAMSFGFIFHLQMKSRNSLYLEQFNSLWTVRFLLVSLITFWALNELLRVPFFRHRYIFPTFPRLTLAQQANLCEIHNVLSLGFFQPGFLLTLLFLVDVSIRKRSPGATYAAAFVLTSCIPIWILQIFIVCFSRWKVRVPEVFFQSSSISKSKDGKESVQCTYPLFSTALFAVFGGIYMMLFLFSFWRVTSLVINQALRKRIRNLTFTVMAAVPLQVMFMALQVLWRPEKATYGGVALLVFLTTFLCAAVGEGILVIKPIKDSLAAGGECCAWNPESGSRKELPPAIVEELELEEVISCSGEELELEEVVSCGGDESTEEGISVNSEKWILESPNS